MAQQISSNTFGVAKWIVSPTLSNGTHTTIAGATASASSGDTIYIRDGTYTENWTAKAGVNYCSFAADALTPNVILNGKVTISAAGTNTFSGLCFQTNSDYCLNFTGSNSLLSYFINCYIYGPNNTCMNITNNNAGIYVYFCVGDLGASSAYFVKSGNGHFKFFGCDFFNSGGSTTASTLSGNGMDVDNSFFFGYINNSGTTNLNCAWSEFQNITCSSSAEVSASSCNFGTLTHTGTGSSTCLNCEFNGGSSSAVSIGSGTTVTLNLCDINSSNTNCITGSGTLNYQGLTFSGSSSLINVTTQLGGLLKGGQFQAPSAGFIGERFRSTGTVTLSTGTPLTVCSITMTPGIYDVTGMCDFAGTVTGTNFTTSISNTNNVLGGASGDNQLSTPIGPTAASNSGLSIIVSRATVTTNTTYYLVSQATFTVGTLTANGKICATRVA